MSAQKQKLGKSLYLDIAAIVFAVISVIIYVVNATTGYLAGKSVNAAIIALTIVSAAALAAVVLMGGKLDNRLIDLLMVASAVMLIVSMVFFVLDRVSIIADIYFLPVNYPAAEEATLNVAFVGFALYLVSILLTAVAVFINRPGEKA